MQRNYIAIAAALLLGTMPAAAQVVLPNPNVVGHMSVSQQAGAQPTLGTCTSGAIVSGSSDMAGGVTSNASTSCAVVFGTPFNAAPWCTVSAGVGTAAVAGFSLTALSTTGFTLTSTSGNIVAFQWLCLARAGG